LESGLESGQLRRGNGSASQRRQARAPGVLVDRFRWVVLGYIARRLHEPSQELTLGVFNYRIVSNSALQCDAIYGPKDRNANVFVDFVDERTRQISIEVVERAVQPALCILTCPSLGPETISPRRH
jgi:hypothetical protein